MRNPTEAEIQGALVQWFGYQYPNLAPLLWHTPNGGSRHILEAAKLKRQGVRAGIPDLFLAVPCGTYHGLFIELKAKKKKPTPIQQWYLDELEKQGYSAGWVDSLEDAKKIIVDYLSYPAQTPL